MMRAGLEYIGGNDSLPDSGDNELPHRPWNASPFACGSEPSRRNARMISYLNIDGEIHVDSTNEGNRSEVGGLSS